MTERRELQEIQSDEPTPQEFKDLLKGLVDATTPEAKLKTQEKVKELRAELQIKKTPLEEALTNLETEYKEKIEMAHLDVSIKQTIKDRVQGTILIGTTHPSGESPRYESYPIYQEGVAFGFTLDEVISMIEFAINNDEDPLYLLHYCELTRKNLEHRWGDHHTWNEHREKNYRNLIHYIDPEAEDWIVETNKLYIEAIKIMRRFYTTREGVDEKVEPIFRQMEVLLINTDTKLATNEYMKDLITFCKYMQTEAGIESFFLPTYSKYHYEEFSFKEK